MKLSITKVAEPDHDMTLTKLASAAPASLKIDQLLNAVPEDPALVLSLLRKRPELASAQDSHGYSLLHAAASFAQLDLLRALVQDYHVPVDLVDEDEDTALFTAEDVAVAKILVNELGADLLHRDAENLTARQYIEQEGDFPAVATFLRQIEIARSVNANDGSSKTSSTEAFPSRKPDGAVPDGNCASFENSIEVINSEHPPPPLPPGVSVNLETLSQLTEDAPDPQFRKRIEELAAREDFEGEESQKELKRLITDAVNGLTLDESMSVAKRRA